MLFYHGKGFKENRHSSIGMRSGPKYYTKLVQHMTILTFKNRKRIQDSIRQIVAKEHPKIDIIVG